MRLPRKLGQIIAGEQRIAELAHRWDETRYDAVLRFDRMSPEAAWSFCLLAVWRFDGFAGMS